MLIITASIYNGRGISCFVIQENTPFACAPWQQLLAVPALLVNAAQCLYMLLQIFQFRDVDAYILIEI